MLLTRGCAADQAPRRSGAPRAWLVVLCALGGYALLAVFGTAANADTGTASAGATRLQVAADSHQGDDADAARAPDPADSFFAVPVRGAGRAADTTQEPVAPAPGGAAALTTENLSEGAPDEDVARRAQDLIGLVPGTPTSPARTSDGPAPTVDTPERPLDGTPAEESAATSGDTQPAAQGSGQTAIDRSQASVPTTFLPTAQVATRTATAPSRPVPPPEPAPGASSAAMGEQFSPVLAPVVLGTTDRDDSAPMPALPSGTHHATLPVTPAPTGQVASPSLPFADLVASPWWSPPGWMLTALGGSGAPGVRDGALTDPPFSPD